MARRAHEATPPEDRGPKPAKDDLAAAIDFVVQLNVKAALKGDGRAAIHLDERLLGRVKYQVEAEHGSRPDAPVTHKHIIEYVTTADV
jgi:hypothetical protein